METYIQRAFSTCATVQERELMEAALKDKIAGMSKEQRDMIDWGTERVPFVGSAAPQREARKTSFEQSRATGSSSDGPVAEDSSGLSGQPDADQSAAEMPEFVRRRADHETRGGQVAVPPPTMPALTCSQPSHDLSTAPPRVAWSAWVG